MGRMAVHTRSNPAWHSWGSPPTSSWPALGVSRFALTAFDSVDLGSCDGRHPHTASSLHPSLATCAYACVHFLLSCLRGSRSSTMNWSAVVLAHLLWAGGVGVLRMSQ